MDLLYHNKEIPNKMFRREELYPELALNQEFKQEGRMRLINRSKRNNKDSLE